MVHRILQGIVYLYLSIAESKWKMKRKIRKKRRISIWAVITAVLYQTVFLTGCGEAVPQRLSSVDTAMGTIVTQTMYVLPGSEDGSDGEKSQGSVIGEESAGGEAAQGSAAEEGSFQEEAWSVVEGGSAREGEVRSTAGEETDRILQLLADLEEQELSWRISESEIARINEQAQEAAVTIPLSASMQQLLSQIWQVSVDSGGALDVTVGKLSRLWNLDEMAGAAEEISRTQLPTAQQIQAALTDTGYDRVQLSEGGITLPAGMQLDLGAVGKGIACDRISEYLHSQSRITGAVVAVGGSVVTYGQKPDGTPWTVAIVHPREEGSYLGTLELTGEHYISTSGDYERYILVDGVRYHHILDPATGDPARSGLCSVTIVCDNGLLADALSTACFVLGPEQGLSMAERWGAEALLAEEDGTLYMTAGMEEIFTER